MNRSEMFLITIGCIILFAAISAEAKEHGHSNKWGHWSQWSTCNADCGTGVSVRVRECLDRLQPENCRANEKQFKVCNREECQHGHQNLRQKQCSAHNDKEFRGRLYRWLPYILDHNGCEVTCRAEGYGFYNSFSDPIINGTTCSKDGKSVCVEGVCTKIGCDDIVGSNAEYDICGVCKGNGTSCRRITDVYDEALNYGTYHHIGSIPKGARNINITQLRSSRNYLALRISDNRYFLNGHRRLSHDGMHKAVGTDFMYYRRRSRKCPGECILSKGPTTEEIDLMVLSFSHNPGIVYHYSLPNSHITYENVQNNVVNPTATYEAIIVEDHFNLHHKSSDKNGALPKRNESLQENSNYTETYNNSESQDNGNGTVLAENNKQSDGGANMPGYTQSFTFLDKIVEKNKRNKNRHHQKAGLRDNPPTSSGIYKIQSDKQFPYGTGYSKTGNDTHLSNVIPGTFRWEITGYTTCNKPCGGGKKTPFVECFYGSVRVDESQCSHIARDKTSLQPISCNTESCSSRWHTSDWSRCSVTCGRGRQTRTLTCVHEVSPSVMVSMEESDCYGLPRPDTSQICLINDCNKWKTERWSSCSVSCGDGKKRRRVYCISDVGQRIRDEYCDQMKKPISEKDCNKGPCSKTSSVYVSMRSWFHTEWPRTCPTECGTGKQIRKVRCLGSDINTDPTKSCRESNKPDTERECQSPRPCSGMWFAGEWNKCNVTCGEGYQHRDVVCIRKETSGKQSIVPEYNCPRNEKPDERKDCLVRRRCPPEWYLSEWSECSVTCGRGQKKREATCIDQIGRPSRRCSEREKPRTVETCQATPCTNRNSLDLTFSDGECRDKYHRCDLVVQAKLCRNKYYKMNCCQSC